MTGFDSQGYALVFQITPRWGCVIRYGYFFTLSPS